MQLITHCKIFESDTFIIIDSYVLRLQVFCKIMPYYTKLNTKANHTNPPAAGIQILKFNN